METSALITPASEHPHPSIPSGFDQIDHGITELDNSLCKRVHGQATGPRTVRGPWGQRVLNGFVLNGMLTLLGRKWREWRKKGRREGAFIHNALSHLHGTRFVCLCWVLDLTW